MTKYTREHATNTNASRNYGLNMQQIREANRSYADEVFETYGFERVGAEYTYRTGCVCKDCRIKSIYTGATDSIESNVLAQ